MIVRKYILLVCFAILIFALWFFSPHPGVNNGQILPSPSPSPSKDTDPFYQYQDIGLKDKTHRVAWFSISVESDITLIPNFLEKQNSQTVRDNQTCQYLTNGGFYTQTNTPLGLFVVEGKTISKYKNSSLFNGIFSVARDGKAAITTEIPSGDTRFQLQSGPILINGGEPIALRLKNDEIARRIFVAITGDGKVIFGVAFDPESTFDGPNLADLPGILDSFQKKTNIIFDMALNLDGGSASAFASEGIFLQELSGVGSFFCIQ